MSGSTLTPTLGQFLFDGIQDGLSAPPHSLIVDKDSWQLFHAQRLGQSSVADDFASKQPTFHTLDPSLCLLGCLEDLLSILFEEGRGFVVGACGPFLLALK